MILRLTLRGNIHGKQRAGRLMQLHSARRERACNHVPAQQRAGQLSKQQKRARGAGTNAERAGGDEQSAGRILTAAFGRFS
jgi:hypothetical protein